MTAEPTEIHAPIGAPGQPQQPQQPQQPHLPPARLPKKQKEKKDRGRLFNWLTDKGAPLLAAVLTVVASLVGIWGAKVNKENDELAADVSALKDQRNVLGEDNEDLTAELAEMTTSRDSWKQRAEAAEKTPGTTPTTEPPVDPDDPPGDVPAGAAGIFRQTGASPLTFAEGYGIDLDTRDTNWSVGRSSQDLYLNWDANDLRLYVNSGTVALVDSEASFADCEAQTILQGDLGTEQTVVGRQFCAQTSENRWAYVKIVGLDTERGTITLHIVVYTLETD